jgi:peptide deformylase
MMMETMIKLTTTTMTMMIKTMLETMIAAVTVTATATQAATLHQVIVILMLKFLRKITENFEYL